MDDIAGTDQKICVNNTKFGDVCSAKKVAIRFIPRSRKEILVRIVQTGQANFVIAHQIFNMEWRTILTEIT